MVHLNDYITPDPLVALEVECALETMRRGRELSCLLLDGPPGTGKTYLGKILAARLSAELIMFQCFEQCGKAEMLLESHQEGLLPLSLRRSHEGYVVLLINEMDKATVSLDTFLLDFLQEARLYLPQLGEPLLANPAQLLVVLTKNKRRDLDYALMRRCRVVEIPWPAPLTETQILQKMVPDAAPAMCLALIEPANLLRSNPGVRKPPSPPELARLLQDVLYLHRQHRSSLTPLMLGQKILRSLCVLASDREHMPLSPVSIGLTMKESLAALS